MSKKEDTPQPKYGALGMLAKNPLAEHSSKDNGFNFRRFFLFYS